MATETWYLLKDGTYADPNECATGDDGVLRHENGMEVAMRDAPNVPHTSSVDPDEQRKGKKKPATEQAKEMKPEPPKRAYKTREMKAKD